MTGKGQPSRSRVVVAARDENRIVSALESWATAGPEQNFIALRTRAIAYLLWDGALRTRPAVHLNAEEVVHDPGAARVSILKEVTQRPCEANRFRELRFFTSARARGALLDYLRVVRREGYLPGARLQGPLFISTRNAGSGARLSARTAVHAWQSFLQERAKPSRDYQLDDLVYSGRLAFLQAAGGDSDLLSDHASLSPRMAAQYLARIDRASGDSVRAVLDRLHPR